MRGLLIAASLAVGLSLLAASLPAARAASSAYLAPAWVKTFGTAGVDQGWGVDVGPSGEVYVTGFVQGKGNDVFLARLDSAGNVAWQKTWSEPNSQKGFEVRYAAGDLYVGGVTQHNTTLASQDMFLWKVGASDGTRLWNVTWNGPADQYDELDGIVVANGTVTVSGWGDATMDFTQGQIALVRYTTDGALVRQSLWGGPAREEGNGALVTDGTNLYVAGCVNGTNLFSGGDAVVVAFNATTLTEVWNRTWGGSAIDDAYGIALVGDRLYATGLTNSFGGDRIFLLGYETSGNRVAEATWGASGSESARAIGATANGGAVYIAGKTTSYGNGSFDVVLLTYDANGTLVSYPTWGGSGSDSSHGIAVSGPDIYIVGETTSYGSGSSDVFILKIGSVGTGGGTPPPPPSPSATGAVVVVLALGLAAVLLLVLGLALRRRRGPR